MKTCEALHPSMDSLKCEKDGEGSRANHPEHTALDGQNWVDWPNASFEAPPKRKKAFTRDGGKTNKNKGILMEMANRTKDTPKEVRHYIPTETDARGRVALYLLKYLGEWVSLEELQIKDIAGSAAEAKCQELINIGWPVERTDADNDPRYKLTEDLRKPLWQQS